MGQQFSELIDCERTSWVKEHALVYNNEVRRQQMDLVDNLSSPLQLCYKTNSAYGLNYEHWFVTDDTWTIEFGDGEIHDAVVTIRNRQKQKPYVIHKEFTLEAIILERITDVIGTSNYSLAFRNCEHVARYIQSGAWVSFQMVGTGVLIEVFRNHLDQFRKRINQLPRELEQTKHTPSDIYPASKYTDHLKFTTERKMLTIKDNACYNIIFLGPTGSGKSTLINHLYNSNVMVTDDTAASVTSQVVFTAGEYTMHDEKGVRIATSMKFNIIDTIGMCDSTLSRHEVYKVVEDSVKTNLLNIDKVVVVCSGRIEGVHEKAIKQFMEWLMYDKYKDKFVFIYNKADGQTASKKEINLQTMCERLGVDTSKNVCRRVNNDGTEQDVSMNCAIGFPPNASFERVEHDLHALVWGTVSTRDPTTRIPVSRHSTCTIL